MEIGEERGRGEGTGGIWDEGKRERRRGGKRRGRREEERGRRGDGTSAGTGRPEG